MTFAQLDAERAGDRLINLVPRQRFIPGNLERLPDRAAIPHQPSSSHGIKPDAAPRSAACRCREKSDAVPVAE